MEVDHGKGVGVLLTMSAWKAQGFKAMATDLTQALRSHLNIVQFRGCPELDLWLPSKRPKCHDSGAWSLPKHT